MSLDLPPPKMPTKKPPLGLVPRWLIDEHRRNDILAAMVRYHEADAEIPNEWVEELAEIVVRLKNRKK